MLIFSFTQSTLQKKGDYKPYCWSPDQYEHTLQPTTKFLDLQKYQGKWYEIARAKTIIEFRFVCVESVYKYNESEDEKFIDVNIKFFKKNNDIEELNTKGVIKNDTNTDWNITFHHFMTGAYFVLDFDNNYQWALIGEPCRDYFWIISKNPKLEQTIINELLDKAQNLGFDISQMIYRKDTCSQQISFM